MKRLMALLLCAALAAGIFSGCDQEPEPYTPTGDGLTVDDTANPSQSVVTRQELSLPYRPNSSMNPYKSSDYLNRGIFSLVYQGLFAVDREYTVWPILCDRYQVSWDMKTYTFYLAEATFSDGSAVTAGDVAASLKAALNSDVYKGRLAYVENVAVTEDGAVTVTLETPYENFPILLDIPIVKQDQVAADRPMGTGPYALDETEDGLRLRRRLDWWSDAAVPVNVEWIDLVKGESPSQLRDAFEFSDLSMVTADPGSENYVDFHSDYELWDSENGMFLYLACNSKSPVLSVDSIRQALTYAIDRDGIAEEYYRGFAYSTVLPASPQSPYYSAGLANQYSYEPGRLTQAVAAAGLEDTSIVLLVNADDGVRLRAARAIARSLSQCGLKVTMSELDTEDYRTALEQGEFDLYLGQTKLSANMDLSAFFSRDGALNYGGMADGALYALCLDSLANIGNYYTLHQKILEDGRLCPVLLRSYAVFSQRGEFSQLQPSRDNLFFYHLGRTLADARVEE